MRSSGKLLSLIYFAGFGVLALGLMAGVLTGIEPAAAGSPGSPGWLGVRLQELDSHLREAMDLPSSLRGALVARVVPDSPADQAGIREGDVITEFDSERIRDVEDLMEEVGDREAGTKALVVVHRDGKSRGLSVMLGSREDAGVRRGRVSGEVRDHLTKGADPRRAPRAGSLEDDGDADGDSDRTWTDDDGRVHRWKSKDGDVRFEFHRGDKEKRHRIRSAPKVVKRIQRSGGFLGVESMPLDGQLAEYFEVSSGVLVTKVVEGSPAETAGLKAGDVILAVDGRDVDTPADLRRLVGRLDPEDDVAITIQRRGQRETKNVTLADRKDFSFVPEASDDHRVFAFPLDDLEHLELPDLGNLEFHGLEDVEFPEMNWVPDIEFHGDLDDANKERLREELQKLRDQLHELKDRIHIRSRDMREIRSEVRDRVRDQIRLREALPVRGAARQTRTI